MNQTMFSQESMAAIQGVYLAIVLAVLFIVLIGAIVKFYLWAKVLSKAGYSKGFAFLLCAPFGAFIILCILAFGDWPTIQKPQISNGSKINP